MSQNNSDTDPEYTDEPGSCEGHGQKRICLECVEKDTVAKRSSEFSSTTKKRSHDGDDCHAGIGGPASLAETQRSQTNEMLGLLDNLQKGKQIQQLPQENPPPPPPKPQTSPLQLGNPFASTNVGPATGTSEGRESEDNGEDSDNDGSEDSVERKRKKRITPDAKYEFLGDSYGYLRLPGKKRVHKNKLRNNVEKK